MTNQEFSDTFTTMLNSFNTQASFGEQASKQEIVLDEYEKSVFLTQAQDIIVKSYFDGTLNQQGQGFDDSARRQIDFSSLIKIKELTAKSSQTSKFDERGILFELPKVGSTAGTCSVLFILNEMLVAKKVTSVSGGTPTYSTTDIKKYVVVPISFKEYDREMSKPYAQPLKKQAWRLLQRTATAAGYDVDTELIPRHDIELTTTATANKYHAIYRLRYIERPAPIILTSLPDGLQIDGKSAATECSLNPIIHMDILNKAVELAIATRVGYTRQSAEEQRRG